MEETVSITIQPLNLAVRPMYDEQTCILIGWAIDKENIIDDYVQSGMKLLNVHGHILPLYSEWA
jgi:hypothetical protein